MSERVFTVFQGPDAGTQFVLKDKPLALGRDAQRDIVLHDDRASRLHARLVPDGDRVLIVDANSSNGTFVNGALIDERQITAGDIIQVGGNSIVFGSAAPPPLGAGSVSTSYGERGRPAARFGSATNLLGHAAAMPRGEMAPMSVTAILEAVAEAAQPAASARSIQVSVESELVPDVAAVDAPSLYQALAGLLAYILELLPASTGPESAVRQEGTLALRLSPDPSSGGCQVEMIGIGVPIPRQKLAAGDRETAILCARQVAAAHGGSLHVLPPDSRDTLARLCLPGGLADQGKLTEIVSK